MDFLAQLMSQFKQPGQPQLMQVGRNGKPQPSTQGHLPPAQQRDTWLEPAALNASPNGNVDSWNANDPQAMYPPIDPRSRMGAPGYQPRPTNPAQMRQQPQQQDPLAQLRQLLGF